MSTSPDGHQQLGLKLATSKYREFRRALGGIWLLPSDTSDDDAYVVVDATRQTCSCPDHADGGVRCVHLWAVAYVGNEITLIDGTAFQRPRITVDAEPQRSPTHSEG